MTTIGPGDLVEFIGPEGNWGGSGLTIGARYIVTSIHTAPSGRYDFLILMGRPGRWVGYAVEAFRKIDPPPGELVEAGGMESVSAAR